MAVVVTFQPEEGMLTWAAEATATAPAKTARYCILADVWVFVFLLQKLSIRGICQRIVDRKAEASVVCRERLFKDRT